MYNFDYTNLYFLIPPAVIVTLIAYFIRFFGKIISDQKPFSDDRNWEIEINGFYFVLNLIFVGAIGITVGLYLSINIAYWLVFILISIIGSIILFSNLIMINKKYNGDRYLNKYINKIKINENKIKILNTIIQQLLPITLFYLMAQIFLNYNLFWVIITSCTTMLILVMLALNYSLIKTQIIIADIYFIDKNEPPLKNIRILKINKDNVRIKDNDKNIILNKNLILKIENNKK